MKAAKLLPFLKLEALPTEATSALAASGPMPGIVARRLLASFDLCQAITCRSSLRLAVIRYAQRHGTRRPWLLKLLLRRTTKIAAVALANKMARIAWVLMRRGGAYREPVPAAV